VRIKQVSVFVENQPGRLVEMLQALKEHQINISALSVADTIDFGIVRLVVSDVDKGLEALRRAGFTARVTEVLQAVVPDTPGGLVAHVVEPLAKAGMNIEYVYAFVDPAPGTATVVLKVRDLDKAEQIIGE
jgi:hypothetical protein